MAKINFNFQSTGQLLCIRKIIMYIKYMLFPTIYEVYPVC